MSAEPVPARAGRAGRGRRLRRLARRAAIVVVVAWAALTVASFGYPQMSAADAAATAVRIGAAAPVTVPGRHLTMISAPGQLAEVIDAFIRARARL